MNQVLAIIRLFRFPNLLIVFLTQFIPYWFILRPAILKAGGLPVLTPYVFGLIAGATVLTTLAGYVLNDYYDREIDAINKPHKVIWGKYLPETFALVLYSGLVILVHLLAFMIDQRLQSASHWPLWVFPGVSFLLFLYAWQLKCTAIIGNLLVSILCGVVPVIMLFPENRPLWLTSFIQPEAIQTAVSSVWMYGLFAFLTNLLREQVKDLEDFVGDSQCGCGTLAVLKGPRFARKPAGFTGFTVTLLIGFLLFFWKETGVPTWQVYAGAALLMFPALIATIIIWNGQGKKEFSRASLLVKLVMFAGLFLLLRSWPEDLSTLLQTKWIFP